MLNSKHLETLAQKLYATLPASLKSFENDIQQQFKDVLQSVFNRLDLVTREEFDVQVKVLARTREKVEALQKQLNELHLKNA
jgi:BMFP domain-containing protein YqiC